MIPGDRSGSYRATRGAAHSRGFNGVAKKFPSHPIHPERICWGCDHYCPADDLRCGNGTDRTQHPVELFGDDWLDFGPDAEDERPAAANDRASVDPAGPSPGPSEDQVPSTRTGPMRQ